MSVSNLNTNPKPNHTYPTNLTLKPGSNPNPSLQCRTVTFKPITGQAGHTDEDVDNVLAQDKCLYASFKYTTDKNML